MTEIGRIQPFSSLRIQCSVTPVQHLAISSDAARDAVPASAPTRRVGEAVPAPSPETERLYAGDWAGFSRWCLARGVPDLPAVPGTVAAYLSEGAA